MTVIENKSFSVDYHDPAKRSIANALEIRFKDGTSLPKVIVEYTIGHRRRRKEATPLIFDKFEANLASRFPREKAKKLRAIFEDHQTLLKMPVNTLIQQFVA
jgi:2-methylcitrate dehydratase